jgi:lysozyme
MMSDLYQDTYTDTYGAPMAITLGIDVSKYQGTINWAGVAGTAYRFGISRMSIGRGTLDETGRRNLKASLDSLPVAGGYGVVGVTEPVEDGAKLLLHEIASVTDPTGVLVMLDAENFSDGSHPTIDQVDRYAKQIHADLGRWPIAYVPNWWLVQHGYTVAGRGLANSPWAPSHYLAAPWTEEKLEANKPTNLRGFDSLGWLQYTSSATVAGVAGRVDANVFYGTLADLKARLLGQGDDMSAADVAAINKHADDLYRLLAKPSDGRANLTDLKAGIAAVTGEVDATQTAIANLQLAAVDPVTLAAALGPLIGQDLADKVAAELSARLAQ